MTESDERRDLGRVPTFRYVKLVTTDGKAWLVTLDLGKVIPSANLTPELLEKAELVRDNIVSIMEAGANGDL